MANITRFNPLEDAFERLVRRVPVWLPDTETRAPAPTPYRIDVTENDKECRVLAEMPGVKKEEMTKRRCTGVHAAEENGANGEKARGELSCASKAWMH